MSILRFLVLTLLTTLLYSATPPEAAVAANGALRSSLTSLQALKTPIADKTYKAEIGTTPTCISEEASLSPEVLAKIEAAGGSILRLNAEDSAVFQQILENNLGEKAPWSIDKVIIVHAAAEAEGVNVGLFVDNCLQGFLTVTLDDIKKIMQKITESHI